MWTLTNRATGEWIARGPELKRLRELAQLCATIARQEGAAFEADYRRERPNVRALHVAS